MAEQASTLPVKGLYSLKLADFLKGVGIALFGNISAMIIFLIKQDHWPSYAQWQPYIEVTVTTFLAYISKNFLTNNVGQLFTADKPVVHVDVEDLKDLKDKAAQAEAVPTLPYPNSEK